MKNEKFIARVDYLNVRIIFFIMRISYFFIVGVLFLSILISSSSFAHTISRDLEQTYINSYFPLFFLAKLLPFIGLGVLAFNPNDEDNVFQFRWQFFAAMFPGLVLGYYLHNDFTTSMVNKVGLIFIGILLLFTKNTNNRAVVIVFFIFGITLGFEYGRHFLHTRDFMWYYAISLVVGSLTFILLNNFRIIGNPKLQAPLNVFSLFLIISGIVLVLLA